MGEGDSTGGFGGFGSDYTGSGFTPQTLSPDTTGGSFYTGDYGNSASDSLDNYVGNLGAERMLAPDGQFGSEALQDNSYQDDANYSTPNVDYDAWDWLKGNYQKYSKYINPALGLASRMNPAVGLATGLAGMFMNPRGSIAGQAGGGLMGAVGSAVAGPGGGLLGSMWGQSKAGQMARDAEGTYGMATDGPKGSQGRTGGADWGLLGSAFLGQKAANDFKGQRNNLQSLYGQNSPYAQQLRQTLSREDARAGRRSQSGTREVELQARLAQLNSNNAERIQSLTRDQRSANVSTLRDLTWLGNQAGWFGG